MTTISKKLMAVMAIAILGMTGLTACSSDGGSGSGKVSHRLAGGRMDPRQEPLENDVYNIIKSDLSQITFDEGMSARILLNTDSGSVEVGWTWEEEERHFYMGYASGDGDAFLVNLGEDLASKYCTATSNNFMRPSRCEKDSFVEIDGDPHNVASMIAKQITPIMKDIYDHYGEVEMGYIQVYFGDQEVMLDTNADGDPSD